MKAFDQERWEKLQTLFPSLTGELYNPDTHRHVTTEYAPYAVRTLRGVILPLPKEEWPEQYQQLLNRYEHGHIQWPRFTAYAYAMEVLSAPFLPVSELYFGYAIENNTLRRCAFHVMFQMVERTFNEETFPYPQEFAIDPLAVLRNKKPDCYVGVSVPANYLEQWLTTGRNSALHPLEQFVTSTPVLASPSPASRHPSEPAPEKFLSPPSMINRKLKSLYFVFGDEFYAPFPRGYDTFEDYLFMSHYEYDTAWQEKVLLECGIATMEEYTVQLTEIKKLYTAYCDQQHAKRERKETKRRNKYYARCEKEGIEPF